MAIAIGADIGIMFDGVAVEEQIPVVEVAGLAIGIQDGEAVVLHVLSFYDEYVVVGIYMHAKCIVFKYECRRSCIGAVVDGVDAGGGIGIDNGPNGFGGGHGVERHHYATAIGIVGGADKLVGRVGSRKAVAHGVGHHHAVVFVGRELLQYVNQVHRALAETGQDKGAAIVSVLDVVAEGLNSILRCLGADIGKLFSRQADGAECKLVIVRGEEVDRITKHLSGIVHLGADIGEFFRGVAANVALVALLVLFAQYLGGNNIEYIYIVGIDRCAGSVPVGAVGPRG